MVGERGFEPPTPWSHLESQLGNYAYELGPTGNRTSVSEPSGRSVTWSYDGICRLTNEAITGAPSGKNGTVAYGLDPVGNRQSETSSLSGVPSGSFSFNADDEVASETYDSNGNTTATGGKTYAYDSENHLVSMNGGAVQLMYDGDGNRVAKSVNGVVTYYLVDDLNPTGYPQVVEELSGAGAVQRVYTYGVQRISQNQVISNAWTPSFYGYDGGGTVRALTNTAGAVTDSYEYDAFGNGVNTSGNTPNNMLYRGEELDPDLGLYYLRARYYNYVTGRFVSRDPENGIVTDPKTLHKYLYADGDPVDLSDPTGRSTAALPMPGRATVGGGDVGDYALIVLAIGFGSVAVDKAVACELSTAFDYLKKSLGSAPSGNLAIPEPDECKAGCPPCDPPVGTKCYVPNSGHPHPKALGWDPHYHIWNQGQDPETCTCHWRENHGSNGTYQFPPLGLYECDFYPSWPNN